MIGPEIPVLLKASRKGQKFGADGLGTDSVICAQTADLLSRPVGYTDWVSVRIGGSFVLRPLLDGERRYDLPAPGAGGTGPRTVREFAAGGWLLAFPPLSGFPLG